MILGIDLDGCAYDFVKNFLRFSSENGYQVPDNYIPDNWLFYEDLGMNLEQFVATIEAGVAAKKIFINDAPGMDYPTAGFTTTMVKLRGKGHKIHVVTHRNAKGAARQTLEWMDKYGVPTDATHFVRDKTVVHVDVLIEDSPGNYYDSVDAGIPCILMDQPWNQLVTGVTRVHDWAEYWEVIESIENGELEWNLTQYVWSRDGAPFDGFYVDEVR